MATEKLIASVSLQQREQFASAISAAAREGANLALEELAKVDGLGNLETFQKEVIERQGEISASIRESVREIAKHRVAEMVQKLDGFVPSFDPNTGWFTWLVDYDQPIADKIAVKDPKSLAWATDYATDEKFPDERRGKRIVSGRVWFPNHNMRQGVLEKESGGVLARPKELIDFSRAFPRPALDERMPLAASGQFWTSADDDRYCLCLRRFGDERALSHVWLFPFEEWDDDWRFLVLDK